MRRNQTYIPPIRRVSDKIKARGEAAKDWLSKNRLTPETKAEFDALMKSVDKQFKK